MRELTIVLNVMNGHEGDILECAREYSVKKSPEGCIVGTFKNNGSEEWAVKMTLTALLPNTRFEVFIGKEKIGDKKANQAGVLETKIIVPPNRLLKVLEIDSDKKMEGDNE